VKALGPGHRKTPQGDRVAPGGRLLCADLDPYKEEIVVPLTQTQLAGAVADRAEITRAEAKRVLDALEDVVLDEIANAEKVKIGGLVQLTVRVKPASKARKGRNPATGEEITIAAKPASVDLRARALTKAKGALPSVQKARRRLS
jgi:DNA-binding protein HU-beta